MGCGCVGPLLYGLVLVAVLVHYELSLVAVLVHYDYSNRGSYIGPPTMLIEYFVFKGKGVGKLRGNTEILPRIIFCKKCGIVTTYQLFCDRLSILKLFSLRPINVNKLIHKISF